MIINQSLASTFLRTAREKIKIKGWRGYESPENASYYSFMFRDIFERDEFRDRWDSNTGLSGQDAIKLAAREYEQLANPNSVHIGVEHKRRNRGDYVWMRGDTVNAYNLAITYYFSSLAEIYTIRSGLEPSQCVHSEYTTFSGHNPKQYYIRKDDVIQAFDFAIASLDAQVRSYPQLVTMAPMAVKRYKEELLGMNINVDKLKRIESEMWDKQQWEGEGAKRKITVKDDA